MTTYVFTYDLNKRKDYPKLWSELERLGAQRALESFWLVNVDATAEEVIDHFKAFVDSDDGIWASELTRNYWYSKAKSGTNDWLRNNPPAR